MQIQLIDQEMTYNGTQLRSHWIYETTGQLGDALVAFIGPCDVTLEHMVDLEDVRQEKPIASRSMLHFIGEFYKLPLSETILLQRLLISQIQQRLTEQKKEFSLVRTGNDLYDGENKLTVSIATASPVSTLLHAGINIVSEGTPVPTRGLADYQVEALPFARQILTDFQKEYESIKRDLAKVRPVT